MLARATAATEKIGRRSDSTSEQNSSSGWNMALVRKRATQLGVVVVSRL
jgi:hypothetical protein